MVQPKAGWADSHPQPLPTLPQPAGGLGQDPPDGTWCLTARWDLEHPLLWGDVRVCVPPSGPQHPYQNGESELPWSLKAPSWLPVDLQVGFTVTLGPSPWDPFPHLPPPQVALDPCFVQP